MKKDLFSELFPDFVQKNALPQVIDPNGSKSSYPVPAMKKGKLTYATPDEVEYKILSPSHVYTDSINLAPMFSTMKGARAFMAGKYFTQALPMAQPEPPLVMSLDEDNEQPLEKTIGSKIGVVASPTDGVVKKITNDRITITGLDKKDVDMELRYFYPHNRKTFTTDTPLVKPGDQVKTGQALAHSNYVNKDGELSIGKNLRVAFMPGKQGGTFEDSITISEGAASKLTSSHLYGFDVENKDGVVSSKNKFIQLFPNKYTKEQLSKIDDNGMIKSGAEINPGDPVFLSVAPRILRAEDRAKGNLHKILKKSFIDKSQTWEKNVNGNVIDAIETRRGLSVNISANFPAKPGDKISSRFAAKGVIGRIIPDDKMFKDKDGNTVDILINPAAMIGRVNPGMVYEALLGKVATKTGKRYTLPSFSSDSFHDFVKNELDLNQVSDTEDLLDPETNKVIPKVLTGIQNFLKLEHTADAKLSAIDEGNPDLNEQPGKPGGSESAKRIGMLDTMALLSHGAVKNLFDIQNYRTGANVDMWRSIKMGMSLPAPKTPFIYEKFTNTLKAAGINPDKKGSNITIKALRRSDIDSLVGDRELNNSDTIDPRTGEPVKGGLMDQSLHGIDGRNWSFISLDEPTPNPILEEPLRKILGLTENKMRDVLSGKEMINGKTGPQALIDAYQSIDFNRMDEDLRSAIRNGSKTSRNDAVKKLNILSGIRKQGLDKDDFFMTRVPVLPPSYRPVSMAGKMMLSADSNYLYKDLMTARDLHRESKDTFGDAEAGEERLAVYDALTAVMGLGDPLHPKLQQKGIKGFIKSLAGSGGPKTGMFLSKVIGHTVNTVGRGVTIPSDDLDMDSIGIPAKMAWKLYAPFVMRRMVKNGMPSTQAALNVERKSDYAKKFLLDEMSERPVLYNRAPALHRFNIMAATPRLVTGDSIQVSPLIVKGFNLDFDGDQMNVHVPVSDDAVDEAKKKLMPSKNLLSIKDKKIFYTPSQEFVLGLYNTTNIDKNKPSVKFKDASDVIAAYRRGEISIDTPVEISA
jgi:biotin carboxyl carrier protein/ribosomal protein L21E